VTLDGVVLLALFNDVDEELAGGAAGCLGFSMSFGTADFRRRRFVSHPFRKTTREGWGTRRSDRMDNLLKLHM